MTIKAKLHKGLQARGKTEIDADVTISKNGTKITVSSGTFIDVSGKEYSVPETVKDIGTSKNDRNIGIWLYEDTNGNVKVKIGEEKPSNVIQTFVASDWFKVPANTSDLSNVDMYAFGWIDEHPENVMKKLPDSAEAVRHKDVQKLKKKGHELKLSNVSELAVQKPSKAKNKSGVKPV